MLRLLAGVAVLLFPAWVAAAPLSRWTSTPMDGATALAISGGDSPALVVLRGAADPIRSFDGGATWTPFRVANQVPSILKASPTDARTWYADGGGLPYRTRDGGTTWTALGKVSDAAPNLYPRITDVTVGAVPDLVYARRYHADLFDAVTGGNAVAGVIVSRDGGATWHDFPLPGRYLVWFVASPVDPNEAWSLSHSGSAWFLQRTRDSGATWVDVGAGLPAAFHPAGLALVLDRRDASIAYLTSAFHDVSLRITVDGGASWTENARAPGPLVPDPLQAGRAFVFESNGRAHETRDAGRTWVVSNAEEAGPFDHFGPLLFASGERRIALQARESRMRTLDLTDGALALGSDLWWNPAQSGTGLTITQHASNRPFVVWYTYDASGAPVWRVVPGGAWRDRTFTGPMYETVGPPYFLEAFDPARVAAREVGTATLRFDDQDNAVFAYSIGGAAGETRIARQLFAPPAPSATDNYADLWWSPAESGWGVAINHQHNRIFATWYVYGDDGKPLWVAMPDAVIGIEFAGAIVRPVATGDIYTTRGPAAGAPFDPGQVVATRIGSATLHFRGANDATLEYTAFGRSGSRSITRQPF